MVKARSGANWTARSRWVLFLLVFLLGCSPALVPATPPPESPIVTDEVIPPEISASQTPDVPEQGGTQTAQAAARELQETSQARAQEEQRAIQTTVAQLRLTQTAEGVFRDQETAKAATPTPESIVYPPATPIPNAFLARYFDSFASFDGVLPGLVTGLKVSPDGTVWVITENGYASLVGSRWTVHFPEVVLWLAGFDANGRTWLVNEAGTAILSWNGSDWRIFGENEGWRPVRTQTMLLSGEEMITDRTGRVWMTTYQDIRSFDGNRWNVSSFREIGFEPSDETEEYEGYNFPALLQDLQGNIWVGNCDSQGEALVGQGARWFDGAAWQGKSDPTASGCVRDIALDPDGRVWLGVDDLLWRFDPKSKSWTRLEPPKPPDDQWIGWIEDIQFDPDGNPWPVVVYCGGASCGSQYLRYQVKQDKWLSIPQPDEYDFFRLYLDPGGNAWYYKSDQLFHLQREALESPQDVEICAIAQDSRGMLFLAVRMDRKKLILVERENP